jgi:hypothetical protein
MSTKLKELKAQLDLKAEKPNHTLKVGSMHFLAAFNIKDVVECQQIVAQMIIVADESSKAKSKAGKKGESSSSVCFAVANFLTFDLLGPVFRQ